MRRTSSSKVMKIQEMCRRMFVLIGLFIISTNVFAQDPNFYIYLCFGQSNMEGQGKIEDIDRVVDDRFQVMEAVSCSNLGRKKGEWYTAIPPLCRCNTGLCPVDYFGKTMVLNLPDNIKVGVINVSVAGCKIELFDRDNYQDYVSKIREQWLLNIIKAYDGNPYEYLVSIARLAQKDGVIKGILLHQGESNTNDRNWPSKVKTVYDNLISDLGLDADSTPLLAGEVVNADQRGVCASMNSIIVKLPDTIPNSYVISSAGCTDGRDNLHFDSAGYRELGRRYAVTMLSIMGYDIANLKNPEIPEPPTGTESTYYEPECATIGKHWKVVKDRMASNGKYVTAKPGKQSLYEAPPLKKGAISFPFSVATTGDFNIFARVNCPSFDNDSFYVKINDSKVVVCNGLATKGWEWVTLISQHLTAGEHTITIFYREKGAKLDKICVSDFPNPPTKMGERAKNICSSKNKK